MGEFESAQTNLEKSIEKVKTEFRSFGLSYPNRNLGHLNLIRKNETKAIEYYLLGYENFFDKSEFWKSTIKDYKDLDLQQYNITLEYFNSIIKIIEKKVEKAGKFKSQKKV